MRRIASLFLLLVLLVPAHAAENGGGQGDVTEVVSPGGVTAWLRQDSNIPLVAIQFRFDGGSAIVPEEKAGTASMAASMLTEGAGERGPDAFREILADNAIRLSFDAGRDGLSGQLVTLNENRDLAVSLLRDALLAPRFEEDALKRVRAAKIKAVRARSQQPNSIAYREWREKAFEGHPYAHGTLGTEKSLARITQQDLKAYLADVLSRQSLIVGAAGDIKPSALGDVLDAAFGELPDQPPPAQTPPLPPIPAGIAVVPHPAPQSVIVFGHQGIKRTDPDWPAAMVITQILGGSTLTSRLGQEIREERGLAYGVGVSLSSYEAGGILLGRSATRNEAVAQTLDLIRSEWRKLAENGPTEAEVEDAKSYLIGSFPLSLDSTRAIASVLVQMQRYDLGREYWNKRAEQFEAVTMEDAQRVAQKLLDADALLSVVVGQPEGVTTSF